MTTDTGRPRRSTRERLVVGAVFFALLWNRCSLNQELDAARAEASEFASEYRETKRELDECIDEREDLEGEVDRLRRR